MNETLKRQFSLMLIAMMMLQSTMQVSTAFAAEVEQVVINEIAWAGTGDGSNDEWIELYNPGNEDIDLSNWYIKDDGSTFYRIESGVIKSHGFFLIEDKEEAVNNVKSDAIIGISLANSGDSLVLFDDDDRKVDAVNEAGEAWYAGDAATHASMERIDPLGDDVAENWATGQEGAALARDGGAILGSPGVFNRAFDGDGAKVSIEAGEVGEFVELAVKIEEAEDLYAYGFDLLYDETVLEFDSAEESDFLSADGAQTAFNFALAGGEEGDLVIGNARLINPAEGIDGDSELVSLKFKVLDDEVEETEVRFGPKSFISDSTGKVAAAFSPVKIKLAEANVPPVAIGSVQNLTVKESDQRYSLTLNWAAPAGGADSYVVEKASPKGEFNVIGNTAELAFVDAEDLVPGVQYHYRVSAVKDGISAVPVETNGMDERGIVGDNDRSDRVDGADIEALARAYASEFGDESYEPEVDGNFDGVIDGNDLIDIGVNFGISY